MICYSIVFCYILARNQRNMAHLVLPDWLSLSQAGSVVEVSTDHERVRVLAHDGRVFTLPAPTRSLVQHLYDELWREWHISQEEPRRFVGIVSYCISTLLLLLGWMWAVIATSYALHWHISQEDTCRVVGSTCYFISTFFVALGLHMCRYGYQLCSS